MARLPLPRPRRLVGAALVGLFAFALAAGAVGMAAANDHGESPDRFGIAVPMQGDAANYTATVAGPWQASPGLDAETEGPFQLYAFRRLPDVVVRDAEGLLRQADVVDVESYHYLDEGVVTTYAYDDERQEMVEQTEHWLPMTERLWSRAGEPFPFITGSDRVEESRYPALTVGTTPVLTSDFSQRLRTQGFGEQAASCVLDSPLQGRTLDVAKGVRLPADCTLPLGGALPAGTLLRADGVERVAGVAALAFQSGAPDDGVRLWYVPEIPYPVALRIATTDPAGEGVRTVQMEMTSFARGGRPLLSKDALADRDPAPALSWRPAQPWGMDDAGVAHPFPLSQAFEAARTDPTWSDLRDFLAREPDAYVAAATYSETGTATHRERSWDYLMRGGDEVLQFRTTQYAPLGGLGLPAGLPMHESEDVPSEWLPSDLPAQGPATMPSAASVLARAAGFVESPLDGWGFAYTCGQTCDEGLLQVYASSVGWTQMGRLPTPQSPNQALGTEFDFVLVAFDATDRALWAIDVGFWSAPDVPTDRQPVAGAYRVQGGAVDVAGLWAAPTPAQAAGAGLLALVAGALYWLWPGAKGIGVALFSRLDRGQVAEHPVRARIVALVEAEPGLHFQELRRRLGTANGTTVHHLRALVGAGLVAQRSAGGYTCYFPRGAVTRAAVDAAPALRSRSARAILAEVRRRPGASNLEVATATGLSAPTVSYHVQRLRQAGLVEAARDGQNVRLRATALAATLGVAALSAGPPAKAGVEA